MYFVDRAKIEKILLHMQEIFTEFQNGNFEKPNKIEMFAIERMTHVIIESILDVGNAMIDGFIMRDPGSYEDIIDILEDERVVSHEQAEGLKELIKQRKILVQEYTELNQEELLTCLQKNLTYITEYPRAIINYLDNELGPVSAFKPHN